MGGISKEILIKRKPDLMEQMLKNALIAVMVMLFITGILGNPIMIVVGLLVVLLCYFVFPRFNVEYEYNYFHGEIDVDKIFSKRKRKRMGTYNLEQVVEIVPTGSKELERYRGDGNIKVLDYSSGYIQVPSWTFVIQNENGTQFVRMELDAEVMEEIRMLAPRKFMTK